MSVPKNPPPCACFQLLRLFPLLSSAADWRKGNLHTHTPWSDGDDYPELVTEWYQQHGYNFLALEAQRKPLSRGRIRTGVDATRRHGREI